MDDDAFELDGRPVLLGFSKEALEALFGTVDKQLDLDCSTKAFEAAREATNAVGISILNATRGGKLEVFPRVDFEDVLQGKV